MKMVKQQRANSRIARVYVDDVTLMKVHSKYPKTFVTEEPQGQVSFQGSKVIKGDQLHAHLTQCKEEI